MGIYINPTNNQTQVAWLEERNVAKSNLCIVPDTDVVISKVDYKTIFPICLVDNGPFTASAVADTEDEFKLFENIDGRLKVWYAIPVCELINSTSGLMPHEINILKEKRDS